MNRAAVSPFVPTLRLYLRRSKGDEHQQFSLDVQREGCHGFVIGELARRGVTVPWIDRVEYVDDDRAGDDFIGRDGLKRLLQEVRKGDVVVCRDHFRFGRDALEFTLAVKELVRERGARLFYYVNGQEVEFQNAIDAAMTFIQGVGGQMELEANRSRTREALRSRVRAGRIAGGRCYGYALQRVAEAGGRSYTVAVVEEKEAAIVRRIFAELMKGNGLKRIAVRLNDDRIPSPAAGRRGSGSWAPSCVRAILRNERYRGVYVHGLVNRVRKGGKRKAFRADPAQVIAVDVPEWRIIDEATWFATRELLKTRGAQAIATGRAARYALSGIVRCGHCGGAIGAMPTKVSGGVRVTGYGCRWHMNRGASVCPLAIRQPIEEVELALATYLRERILTADFVGEVVAAIKTEIDEQLKQHAVDTTEIESELTTLRAELKNLSRAVAIGGGEIAELVAEMQSRNERIRRLEGNLEVARRSPAMVAELCASAEARARAKLDEVRDALLSDADGAREVYRAMFPDGVAFYPAEVRGASGRTRRVWRIKGRARLDRFTLNCDPTGSRGKMNPLPAIRIVASYAG